MDPGHGQARRGQGAAGAPWQWSANLQHIEIQRAKAALHRRERICDCRRAKTTTESAEAGCGKLLSNKAAY